ncbi:MAG TPA: GGDEF domain-containing protein [Bauldia sp.]|nr:GGDEF domain-containing protein [Bauldia sp.]
MPDPSLEPNAAAIVAVRRLEIAALSVISAIAVATLLFWSFPALGQYGPSGWHAMRPFTALWILGVVISLALSAPHLSPAAHRASAILGVVLFLIPMVVLLTYAGLLPYPAALPSRAWPQSVIASALTSLTLPFIRAPSGWRAWIADLSAIGAVGVALLVFSSFAFDVIEFVGIGNTNYTAPQILCCIILLVLVAVGRRAQTGGLFAILLDSGLGTRLARILLPYLLLVPFVLFVALRKLAEIGFISVIQAMAIAVPLVVLGMVAAVVWIARSTNQVEDDLRHQSLTDGLTGVLNRRGFDAVAKYVLRSAERAGTPVTAFFFDLDNLKRVNDDHGHNVGSALIRIFAGLLVTTFRRSDLVARMGGDEFVVLAAAPAASLATLIERLQAAVAEANKSAILPIPIAYSVGYSELLPNSADDIERLLAAADAHMYAEKSRKRAA